MSEKVKFSFDVRGYLVPEGENESDINSMKEGFVVPFNNHSTRKELFKGYVRYNEDLKDLLENQSYEQWIDGSFISQKVNPKDIDLVSFIDYNLVEKLEEELEKFIKSAGRSNYGVDGYVVRIYPEDHPHFVRTKSDKIYWRHWFSTTKPDQKKRRYGKGFIKIKF